MNRLTPIILAVAMFMEMMDATVIATSLPAIAADIGAEPVTLKLAMTAYLVALAIFIPISGWTADRFGAKNVFRVAILIFMAGSLACAFSGSLESFVASRFLQGMGGSLMTPLARLVLVRSTPRKELVNAMAWLTVPALFGPIMGPPVGGFLTTFLSWHWIFFINIPIGLLGILAATIFLPTIPPGSQRPIDWPGFLLLAIAFSGVVFGLSVISLPALPPLIGVATTVLGLCTGALYLVHARKAEFPLLDPALFRLPMFRSAIAGAMLFRVGMGAVPFLLPLMMQLVFHMTPFEAGLVILFQAVGALSAKFTASRAYSAFGFRNLTMALAVLSSIFLAINGTFTPTTPAWMMGGFLLVGGMVRSTFFTGVNAMSFADVTAEESGQATALYSVLTQLSLALGVAVGGGALELFSFLSGGEVSLTDFKNAFFIVAGISLLAFVPFSLLPKNAGSDVSGHGVPSAETKTIAD